MMGRGSANRARGSQGRSAEMERREPGRPRRVTAARPALTAHGAAARSGACAVPPPLPPLPPLPPGSSRQAGRQRAPPRPARPPRPGSGAPPPRPRPPTRNVNPGGRHPAPGLGRRGGAFRAGGNRHANALWSPSPRVRRRRRPNRTPPIVLGSRGCWEPGSEQGSEKQDIAPGSAGS